MSKGFKIKTVTWSTILFSVFLLMLPFLQPLEQNVRVGDTLELALNYPEKMVEQLKINISDRDGILGLAESQTAAVNLIDQETLTYLQPGEVSLSLRLFGLIPVKQIDVNVLPELSLYPGGQPVGILLRTDGIMVVGMSPVLDDEGKSRFPAEKAGIKVGDIIQKVNNVTVNNDEKMAMLIDQLGQNHEEITLEVLREQEIIYKKIEPVYCTESKTYRIGLYVRDNAGGVGTLTFIDPVTKQYGALGHMIANNETQEKLNILNGKLVSANIEGIKKGQRGYPGEKIGGFANDNSLGTIEKNTYAGIFGVLKNLSMTENNYYDKPLPVAYYPEIELGPATILTALEGQKVEAFTIAIEKVMPNGENGKGMVIKVTDPILLEKTGGIIQGMSGSPIIQNGKIIGAVTHVFINDPTKGYGILISDMLSEVGLIEDDIEKSA